MNNGLDNALEAHGGTGGNGINPKDKIGLMHIHKMWQPSRTVNLIIVNA